MLRPLLLRSVTTALPRLAGVLALAAIAAAPAAADGYLSPHVASEGAKAAMARYDDHLAEAHGIAEEYSELIAQEAGEDRVLANRVAMMKNGNAREAALKEVVREVVGVFMLDFMEADHDPEVLKEYWGKIMTADGAIKARRAMYRKLRAHLGEPDALAMREFEIRITLDILNDQFEIIRGFSEWADKVAGDPPRPGRVDNGGFPQLADSL